MDKVKVFTNELNLICDKELRDKAIKAISLIPDYFFVIPSSSSGKYHPAYALGKGGLVRHTKATIQLAVHLCRNKMFMITPDDLDYVIASLLVHDGWKNGLSDTGHTKEEHPLIAADELKTVLPAECLSAIRSHMGQWNKDKNGRIVYYGVDEMPEPSSHIDKYVHLCDYIASRKIINIDIY